MLGRLPPLESDLRFVHRDGSFLVRRDWSLEFDDQAGELCPLQVVGVRVEPYALDAGWFPSRSTYTVRLDQPRAHLELEYRDPLTNDPTRVFERHYALIRTEAA